MKFFDTAKINASLNDAFAALADFEYFETAARHAGTRIKRSDDLSAPGPGMSWLAQMTFRGKEREVGIELVDYDPPNALFFKATMGGVQTDFTILLERRKAALTEASVSAAVTANTLPARLLLRSAKLTKPALNKRFGQRINQLARIVEARSNGG